MNADGSGQRNLTRSPWDEGSACLVARAEVEPPTWSPQTRPMAARA